MSDFKCKKCGSSNYYLKEIRHTSGIATGLFCADCNTWHKWVPKKDIFILRKNAKEYIEVSSEKDKPSLGNNEDMVRSLPIGDELDKQIEDLAKAVASLKILRDKLRDIKLNSSSQDQQEVQDDVPPWD